MRESTEPVLEEERPAFGEHRADKRRVALRRCAPIDHVVAQPTVQRSHPLGALDVAFADLDKAAAVGQRRETRLDRVAGQRVEHHVDAASGRRAQHEW